jgi:hypothetical protein
VRTVTLPGVYAMGMDAYQADPCPAPSLSSGIAHRLVTQSPLHAWFAHPKLNPNHVSEESDGFDLGACSHALLLEGESAIAEIDFDDWRKKEAKEKRDEARAMGKIPVLARKLAACRQMAGVAREAIRACTDIRIDLAAGRAEQVLVWREGEVWCRARPDWRVTDGSILLDYKSTAGSASPNAWIRNQMGPLGYDMQAVHYKRGSVSLGGFKSPQWVFLVQENYPPYACSFVGLCPAMEEVAQLKWEFALALFGQCLARNSWPGYQNEIAYAEPTTWQMDDHEDRRLTFEQRLECATV